MHAKRHHVLVHRTYHMLDLRLMLRHRAPNHGRMRRDGIKMRLKPGQHGHCGELDIEGSTGAVNCGGIRKGALPPSFAAPAAGRGHDEKSTQYS